MLVNSIDQFAAVIPTAVSIQSFDDLKTYVKSGETWLKANVIGSELYDHICASLDTSSSSSSDYDEYLVELCRNVICNHAYWDAIPFLDLVHSSAGFGVIQNNNLVPASKDRVAALRAHSLERRDNEAETLIAYLESHTAYYQYWKSSSAFSVLSDSIITTATELAIYAEWFGSRKDFLKLRPKIVQLTISLLYPVFSKAYITELIDMQRDDDISVDDSVVLIMLKQAIGSAIIGNMEATRRSIEDAINFVENNKESFPTIVESREYLARSAENFGNTAENTIYSSVF